MNLWTVDKLKTFLHEYKLPVAGVKAELVKRVEDCHDTMFFEAECGLVPFQQFHGDGPVPEFEALPRGSWQKDSLLLLKKGAATDYSKEKVDTGITTGLVCVFASVVTCMILRQLTK